ncbi:MAG: MFS transporter [Deltaproteobacteria bacterium]|nr:MFS transporter [Deltaproteobacteria bacterium]
MKRLFSATAAFNSVFRALRHRNYRLFFIGNGISLVGTWMQQIAMSWLIYRLTSSVFLLGIMGFVAMFPGFLLVPIAGVLADRWKRRHIIFFTQGLAMLQALMLALLVLTDTIAPWHIISLSAFLSMIDAFDITARQAFVVDTIEKREDLGNAIALNSAMFNGARLLGPSLAGMLIATVGEGICFLMNSISYLAVIITLMLIHIEPAKREGGQAEIFQGIREGLVYAFRFLPMRYILLLMGLVCLMGMPYSIMMPAFARDILYGGPSTLGFLMAAAGCGALIGAFYLASRRSILGLGKILPLAAAVSGSGIIAFSLSRSLGLSLLLLMVVGAGMMVQFASSNTILQTIVDDDKRGRVMSFFTMAWMGTAPLGSLMAGGLAGLIGVPHTLAIGGFACILGALFYARQLPLLRSIVHPLYAKRGIVSGQQPKI